MYTRLLEPDQILHTQSMVATKGLTNGQTFISLYEKVALKHCTAEFRLDIHFRPPKKRKLKMLTQSCGTVTYTKLGPCLLRSQNGNRKQTYSIIHN